MRTRMFTLILVLALAAGAFAQTDLGGSWGMGGLGGPITNVIGGNISTGSFGAYLCSKIHDTAFERIKEIRQHCDTVVELGTATDVRGIVSQRRYGANHKPIVVWVTIKCVDDTIWEPRTDIKLSPQDIINLKKFLRGEWAPPEPNWNGWINAQDAILKAWNCDTANRREDVR